MRRVAALVAWATLAVASHAADNAPSVLLTRAKTIEVILPATVLRSNAVTRQLTSGLTTAFIISANSSGTIGGKGGARVEIRYELWEERYHVSILEANGHQEKLTLPSRERLVEWWSKTPLVVIQDARATPRVELTLRVLPFSAREQAETQRWLTRTLEREANADPSAPATSAKVLEVIVGTSIKRKPILEYRWTIDVAREEYR